MASAQAEMLIRRMEALEAEFFADKGEPSIDDMREFVDTLGRIGEDVPRVRIESRTIKGVPVFVHVPERPETGRHIVAAHGGGFAFGSAAKSHRNFASHIADASSMTVVNVEFRRAPENPFPAPLDDVRAVVDGLIDEGISPSQIFLCGDSAGGAIALSTLQSLTADGISVAGCILLSPWVDLSTKTDVPQDRLEFDPGNGPDALDFCRSLYIGDADPSDVRISPARGSFEGLPPLLIVSSRHEVLIEDSERIAKRAQDAGVDVDMRLWDAVPHVFPVYAGSCPEADDAVAAIAEWLRKNGPDK